MTRLEMQRRSTTACVVIAAEAYCNICPCFGDAGQGWSRSKQRLSSWGASGHLDLSLVMPGFLPASTSFFVSFTEVAAMRNEGLNVATNS